MGESPCGSERAGIADRARGWVGVSFGRFQFTAPDKSLRVANRDLALVESITVKRPDDRTLDNNRRIEFHTSEHRHVFFYGYAVTGHSSQGLTAERALVHADTRVHQLLVPRRAFSIEAFFLVVRF